MSKFEIGQEVMILGVNIGEPRSGVVTKVGRKLVTVEGNWTSVQYRIEDGTINDQYGHTWIKTQAEYEADIQHNAAKMRLQRLQLPQGHWTNRLSTDALHAIADIVEGDQA